MYFSSFFSSQTRDQMLQPSSSTDTATARKNFRFILSEESYFHVSGNLPIAVHALLLRIVDEISTEVCLFVAFFVWILWYINLCRLFNAKSIFKQMNSSISNNSVLR